MEKDSDKQLLNMLENLVNEKEQSEKQRSILESVLSRNNIYFFVFTTDEEILYHNIPDRQDLGQLSDCEYILDSKNLNKIRDFMGLSAGDAFEITLKNNVLEFTLYTQNEFSGLFFLEITLFNQQKISPQINEESELDQAEIGLEDIQTALSLLDDIRNIDSSEKKEKLSQQIQDRYLTGLDRLQVTIHDPIVSLCLDIIKKNLEEFVSPAGSLSRLYEVLTPSEIQVAEFIRMGKTSKDIADALDIAQKTVENHRNKVRDKLGLRNKGVNLRSYLMQLET